MGWVECTLFQSKKMILADKFVYIHSPKTGGTFVTKMLEDLHKNQGFKGRQIQKIGQFLGITRGGLIDTNLTNNTKHGNCRQIPRAFRKKPIFSTLRNPYDSYVSGYEFKWWKKYPETIFYDVAEVKKAYPNFPDISFADYVRMMDSFFLRKKTIMELGNIENPPGWQTTKFIWYYFKKPLECLSYPLDEKYLSSEKLKEDMFPVRFIKTENLNQDLYDFLIEVGYEKKEIQFILDRKKVLPPSPTGDGSRKGKWEEYYTPELKNFVREREKFLFFMFPDYDVKKK